MAGEPLYLQLAQKLRAKIADGSYPVGSTLPTTKELQELNGVSYTVVRGAIRELAGEGLIEGQPGRGTYVRREPEPAEPSSEYVEVLRQLSDLAARVEELERRIGASDPSASHASRVRREP